MRDPAETKDDEVASHQTLPATEEREGADAQSKLQTIMDNMNGSGSSSDEEDKKEKKNEPTKRHVLTPKVTSARKARKWN